MAKSVPTTSDVMDAGKTGGMDGGLLVAGETAGRLLTGGSPIGTLAGGILAASMEDGTSRDVMATIAVERAGNELLGGV